MASSIALEAVFPKSIMPDAIRNKMNDTLMFVSILRYYTTHKHMRWKPNFTIRSTLLLSIAVLVVVPVVGINFA